MEQVHHSPTLFQISNEYDGKSRRVYSKECPCGKVFWAPKHVLGKRTYCSTSCTGQSQRRRVELKCAVCKTTFERTERRSLFPKGEFHFCSRKCKDEGQTVNVGLINYPHYGSGNSVYRRRAIKFYGKSCGCGYDKDERMLDVHHIDGNRKNGKIENLRVLCVWCHALETRGVEPHSRQP